MRVVRGTYRGAKGSFQDRMRQVCFYYAMDAFTSIACVEGGQGGVYYLRYVLTVSTIKTYNNRIFFSQSAHSRCDRRKSRGNSRVGSKCMGSSSRGGSSFAGGLVVMSTADLLGLFIHEVKGFF